MNAPPFVAGVWGAALVLAIGFGVRPRPPMRPPLDTPRNATSIGASPDDDLRRRPALDRRTSVRLRPAARSAGGCRPDDVAGWCDRLAGALRSGSPLIGAIKHVEPPATLASAHAEAVHDLDRGRPVDQALSRLPNDPHLDLARTAILTSRTNGLDPSEPLQHVATVLRWRAADAAELRSQSAQARASAQVMTVLPIVMLALLLATSGMVRDALTTPIGMVTLIGGGVLNVVGWLWMRRLIRRATR